MAADGALTELETKAGAFEGRMARLEAVLGMATDGSAGAGGGSGVDGAEVKALREENSALKEQVGKLEYRINILLRSLKDAEDIIPDVPASNDVASPDDVAVSAT